MSSPNNSGRFSRPTAPDRAGTLVALAEALFDEITRQAAQACGSHGGGALPRRGRSPLVQVAGRRQPGGDSPRDRPLRRDDPPQGHPAPRRRPRGRAVRRRAGRSPEHPLLRRGPDHHGAGRRHRNDLGDGHRRPRARRRAARVARGAGARSGPAVRHPAGRQRGPGQRRARGARPADGGGRAGVPPPRRAAPARHLPDPGRALPLRQPEARGDPRLRGSRSSSELDVATLVVDGDRPTVLGRIREGLAGDGAGPYTFRAIRKDGELIDVEVHETGQRDRRPGRAHRLAARRDRTQAGRGPGRRARLRGPAHAPAQPRAVHGAARDRARPVAPVRAQARRRAPATSTSSSSSTTTGATTSETGCCSRSRCG